MATFKKLRKNPLDLGSVLIADSEFNDEKLDQVALIKLGQAINAKLVKVVKGEFKAPVEEKAKTIEVTDDNTLVALKDDNAKVTKELEVQISLNEESKKLISDVTAKVEEATSINNTLVEMLGYKTMTADELAKDFTVDELTFLATKLHGLEIKSSMKEATIAKKIIEAVGK